ncbi:MAG TPA: hypothetical protein VF599_25060 [Pyrinomonadaceae bacterium]|jgi:hypothetical protein
MASFWKNLIDLFSSSDEEKRQNANDLLQPNVAYIPRRSDYPNTFDPNAEDDSPGMPQVFDPALLSGIDLSSSRAASSKFSSSGFGNIKILSKVRYFRLSFPQNGSRKNISGNYNYFP